VRSAGRSEQGTTLIELLVAVAIMGIAFVTVVGGIGMAIIGSATQKQKASSGIVLRTAAEAATYQPCTTKDSYVTATLPAPPAGFSVSVRQVSQWDSDTNQFVTDPPSCTDTGLQLIELAVTSSTGQRPVTEALKVVKRKP